MTFSRWTAGIAATALLAVSMAGASASNVAKTPRLPDPTATTVTAPCYGGPGGMSLRVQVPADDGTYQVTVTARGMEEGSRWDIFLLVDGLEPREIRRTAVDGEWSVSVHAPATGRDVEPLVGAEERGSADTHACLVLNSPARPVFGIASCAPRRLAAVALRQLDERSVAVRFLISEGERGMRWHVELTASGVGGRQTVAFDDISRRGLLRSRVELRGIAEPRLHVVATREDGRHCRMRLNPVDVTAQPTVTAQDLVAAARAFKTVRRTLGD